jgi:hypothetical protein
MHASHGHFDAWQRRALDVGMKLDATEVTSAELSDDA